jgi:hypothetical protein
MKDYINNNGIPILRVTKHAIFDVANSDKDKQKNNVQTKNVDCFTYNKIEFVSWGNNNRFPDDAEALIHCTGVLQTALNYKSRCCYGQGVIPAKLTGLDDNLNEIYKPLNQIEILNFLNGYTFQNYHISAFRDINKFGNCFPLLVPNIEGNKIIRIEALNARHCRLNKDKTKLLVYGDFANSSPSADEKNCLLFDMLDESDPQLHLDRLRVKGKLKRPIAFPRIRNYLSNNDYYARTDWWAAYKAGWLNIAKQIPAFLEQAYKNAITAMWHIKVPDAYYDRYFPKQNYENEELRLQAILHWQDELEKELTGTENANKAIFTTFTLNESGRAEEQIVIERLDNKMNIDEKLSTSAAANSEILFSIMVNPSVLGAGMPGGPYAGNAGSGSDIREGLMTSLVLSYIERIQVLNPVKLMYRFNGIEDIDFKYKNIILTTLDKGKSTEEKIS